jgi:hypothetical protein
MRKRLQSGLMRLPGGFGYRLAWALRLQRAPSPVLVAIQKDDDPPELRGEADSPNGSGTAPLEVAVEQEGRRKRLRVRASDDIWSEDFRRELAQDRQFEASLVWKELAILLFIAAVLAARTLGS